MKLSIDTFSGLVPKVAPRLLSASSAQIARNTRIDSGDLEGWKGVSNVTDLAKPGTIRSLYLFEDQYWFHWTQDVDAVRGPVPDDTTRRTYYTGAGKPRFTNNDLALGTSEQYPVASYEIGIPAPASAPALEVTGIATETDPALVENRSYVYTYVSQFGEQGPTSPASGQVAVAPGQDVFVSLSAPPGGAYVLDTIRIYRSASSGGSSAYQLVAEVALSLAQYRDKLDGDRLGEVLESEDWTAPPADLYSLVALPNGILAGASGLDIWLSEAYRPHAWPARYRQTVSDDVVGLGVVANALIVLTTTSPYLMTGATPAGMTLTAIAGDEFACAAKRSIVTMPGVGVVFASPDGLCAINSAQAVNLTRQYMEKRDWQRYQPGSMFGVAHQGRYYGFYDTGNTSGCVVFDPNEGDGALYELDLNATAAYRDAETDTLYLVQNGQVVSWDTASESHAPYVWRSKRYELPYPATFSTAKVRAADYADLNLRIYADGRQLVSLYPDGRGCFRLGIGERAHVWEIELRGTSRVYDVQIGETLHELA